MTLNGIAKDIDFLKSRYRADVQGKSEGRLIIRSEHASECYTTDVLTDILTAEGGNLFDARNVRLGHTLQGGVPSPRDRTRAVRLAVRCIQFIERHGAGVAAETQGGASGKAPSSRRADQHDVAVIIVMGRRIRFAGLDEMVEAAVRPSFK